MANQVLIRKASQQTLKAGMPFFLVDGVVVIFSGILVHWFLVSGGRNPIDWLYLYTWLGWWLAYRWYVGFYPGFGRSYQNELRLHVTTTLQVALIQFASTFAAHDLDSSRLGLGLLWLFLLLTALPLRYLARAMLIKQGNYGREVVILGAGKTGQLTAKQLQEHPAYGLRPVAFYDDNPEFFGQTFSGCPVVGTLQDALNRPIASQVIISIPGARAEVQKHIVNAVHKVYPITWLTPDLFGVPNQAIVPHSIGSHSALEIKNNLTYKRSRFAKRTLDVCASVLGGIAISPVIAVIALAIFIDNPGAVIYRAKRLGRGGKEFGCYKFRTMSMDAEARLHDLLSQHPELKAEFEATHKLRDDPRVTRVGAFLRKTSLDELPQLWNVLKGEMSLVGPRPIVQAEVAKYGEIFAMYSEVRPGMTGYWQVNGRSDTSYDERVEMDRFYVSNWSVWLDLVILIQTARVVFKGKGAY